MKQMMGTSKRCKTSIKGLASGDTFVSNTKAIVNIFNAFFTNVGKNLAVKFKYVCTSIKQDRNVVQNSLKFNSVTPNSVCKQIQSLCSAKASGSDKISGRLLKTAAPQISDSLEENNILNTWQSGFRPGYSTETAMTYVTDILLTEMDSKKLTGVVFLDLKRPLIQLIMHYS